MHGENQQQVQDCTKYRYICCMKLHPFQAQVPTEGFPVLASRLAEVARKHCAHVTEPLRQL